MNRGNHSEVLFTPHEIFKNQRLHEPMQPFPPFMKSKPELRDIFSIQIKKNKIFLGYPGCTAVVFILYYHYSVIKT